MVDLPVEVSDSSTVILLDGGYFVARFSKHWGNRGQMRRAQGRYKKGTINWNARQALFKKAINGDLGYVSYVLSKLNANPKYVNASVIVCYDGTKGRNKRGKLFEDYKANRHRKEGIYLASEHEGSDLRIKLEEMGLTPNNLFDKWFAAYNEEMEADDIIAELTHKALLAGKNIVILSSDSDLVQLLQYPDVRLHNLKQEVTKTDVVEKYGVEPEQFADWKALSGDASDNIPGVPNIGAKKASNLLNEYGSIENIPQDYFRNYKVLNSEILAQRLSNFRECEGLSKSLAAKTYGGVWTKLEQGLEVKLNGEQLKKINQVIDMSDLLSFDDYYHRVATWRKLVILPYK